MELRWLKKVAEVEKEIKREKKKERIKRGPRYENRPDSKKCAKTNQRRLFFFLFLTPSRALFSFSVCDLIPLHTYFYICI